MWKLKFKSWKLLILYVNTQFYGGTLNAFLVCQTKKMPLMRRKAGLYFFKYFTIFAVCTHQTYLNLEVVKEWVVNSTKLFSYANIYSIDVVHNYILITKLLISIPKIRKFVIIKLLLHQCLHRWLHQLFSTSHWRPFKYYVLPNMTEWVEKLAIFAY